MINAWAFATVGQQDTQLFKKTIAYNVAYGVDAYDEKDMDEAVTLANAKEFIHEFDDGYKTRVGNRGIRLSGGLLSLSLFFSCRFGEYIHTQGKSSGWPSHAC